MRARSYPIIGDELAANCLKLLASSASRAVFHHVVWEVCPVRRVEARAGVEATLHLNKLWFICFWENMNVLDVEEYVTCGC